MGPLGLVHLVSRRVPGAKQACRAPNQDGPSHKACPMDYRQSKQQADTDRKAEQAFDDRHRFLVESGKGGTHKPNHHDQS